MVQSASISRRWVGTLMVASLLAVPIVPLQVTPASAQSLLEAFFGRSTFQRPAERPRVLRKRVLRQPAKKVQRTTRRSSPSRSSRGSAAAGVAASQSITYQTLCVRKADGYFFPISFSTTKDYFEKDFAACEARCPGAEVDLYVHRVLREEPEQMVNYKSSAPYADLPTAFAYRVNGISKEAAEACRIEPQKPEPEIMADLGPLPFSSEIPVPGWRPDPNNLYDDEMQEPEEEVAEVTPRPRVIRQVGPRFFPDQ